jgi:transmembrane sensor
MEKWNQLIIKYLADECTDREKENLEEWLHQDFKHKTYFQKFEKLWEHGEIKSDNFNPDVQLALKMIQEKIQAAESNGKVIEFKPGFFYYAKRAAAILIVGAFIGLGSYFVREKLSLSNELTELKTTGQKKELLLSDGTKVWLNENSSIRYPEEFKRNKREIYFDGEGYFEVAKDPQRSFIIRSQNSVTEVIGTSFNVRSFSNEDKIQVTVTSGKVAFYAASNESDKIFLLKGESGSLEKKTNTITKEKNTDNNFLSWQTGKLIFDNTPMEEVALALSRHYRKIIIATGEVAHCKFTSSFDNESVDDVIEELRLLLNIEIQNKDSTILLIGKGC